MEDYAEELRTPPVSLVSLVGVPEVHQTISTFLHSEQPPINTLALPDFSKVSILARKVKEGADSGQPAAGILKREWLKKHRTRLPAVVAALFGSDRVNGDPAQWLQVCTDLDNVKPKCCCCSATVLDSSEGGHGSSAPPLASQGRTSISFTEEQTFAHATQDEDHHSRQRKEPGPSTSKKKARRKCHHK